MILNSWKEISNYVGRGVRTIQRWESDMHFPVHRTGEHLRSSVYALSEEIDEWLKARRNARPDANQERHAAISSFKRGMNRFRENQETFFTRSENLRQITERVKGNVDRAQALRDSIRKPRAS